MWAPGTKVECIDDSPTWCGEESLVTRGQIYTVERMLTGPLGLGVWLLEVDHDGLKYAGFCATRFRPVVDNILPVCITGLLETQAPEKEAETA